MALCQDQVKHVQDLIWLSLRLHAVPASKRRWPQQRCPKPGQPRVPGTALVTGRSLPASDPVCNPAPRLEPQLLGSPQPHGND